MSKKELYIKLVDLRNSDFDIIKNYISLENYAGYVSIVNQDAELGIFEFKVGQFRFLLQSEIQLSYRVIAYKVFSRTLNLDCYPETTRFKSDHIKELNLITHLSGKREFEVKKTSNTSDFARFNRATEFKDFRAEEFGGNLIEQIENWLFAQQEKSMFR